MDAEGVRMGSGSVGLALLVTTLAGLATAVGSLIALALKPTNRWALALALGFSAGAMLFISFVELLPSAARELGAGTSGTWLALGTFLAAFAATGALDAAMPSSTHSAGGQGSGARTSLTRAGLFVAAAVAIHNVPEGMATFFLTLDQAAVGISVAVAIALHNIPEGIAVSAPVLAATGSRARAFGISAASGLAEPAGALIAFLVLAPFLSPTLFGVFSAGAAGLMVYVSVHQILSMAHREEMPRPVVMGVFAGMGMMGASMAFLGLPL